MPPVESREEGEEEDEEESDQELEEREESVDREEQDPNVSSLFCFSLWMWILIPVLTESLTSTQPAFHSHHLERNLMVNLSLCCSTRHHFPLHYSSVFRLPSKV